MPEEVDLALLQSQLDTVCTDPLWLDDSQLCTEFGDLLDLAEDEEGDDNFYGAAAVLGHLKDRVSEEQSSMEGNAFWLLSLNATQAESNALDSAAAVADRWHFRDVANHEVVTGGWTLSSTAQTTGDFSGFLGHPEHLNFYFVKTVESAAAFADGAWSVQLDFFDMTANGNGVSVHDLEVSRHDHSGALLESKYLVQGEVATLPAGDTRLSLTATLTDWSSGSSDDLLALHFRIENQGTMTSESYALRVGVEEGDWGASWVSQPK
jgi:hypothetical protein